MVGKIIKFYFLSTKNGRENKIVLFALSHIVHSTTSMKMRNLSSLIVLAQICQISTKYVDICYSEYVIEATMFW